MHHFQPVDRVPLLIFCKYLNGATFYPPYVFPPIVLLFDPRIKMHFRQLPNLAEESVTIVEMSNEPDFVSTFLGNGHRLSLGSWLDRSLSSFR